MFHSKRVSFPCHSTLLFLVLFVLFPVSAYALDIESYNGQYVVAGEVLVEYNGEITALSADQEFTRDEDTSGVVSHRKMKRDNHYVAEFHGKSVKDQISRMEQSSYVKSVQPNYVYMPLAVPNDAFYPIQWPHVKTGAPDAWSITTGSRNVIVGVIDTGINYNHPDLSANMWTGTVSGQSVHGWNYYDDNGESIDPYGHGTSVAGIIGAVGNNTIGVAGVNWNVSLMSIRVLGAEHLNIQDGTQFTGVFTTSEAIMRGIQFAVDHGARVINLSLGGLPHPLCDPVAGAPKNQIEKQFYHTMTVTHRVFFVAAAGNNHGNSNCILPAAYDDVLAVTATSNTDGAASYSNYAPSSWKSSKVIAAPGGDIDPGAGGNCSQGSCPATTNRDNNYVTFSGTSASTPYVAGVAALILSVNDMDPMALRQHLIDTADDVVDLQSLGGQTGITYGKRINAARALSTLLDPTPTVSSTPSPTVTVSVTLSPTPTVSGTCGPLGDIDCSGEVNLLDLSRMLSSFGTVSAVADIDHSGEVNLIDLSLLLSNFGKR